MPPKSTNNWIEIKAVRRSALKRGGRPAAARDAEHIDRYRKKVKGLELAFNGLNRVAPSCGRSASTEFSSKYRQLASANTPTQIEQTRIGLFDLRAELTTLRERGLSNFSKLTLKQIAGGVVDRGALSATKVGCQGG
jgi:hypothetical protein